VVAAFGVVGAAMNLSAALTLGCCPSASFS